ncbi:MAG: M1 family metallopeptidase [Elusimicrobia bacterium]|nr:M1 family metallopeptidase [Elusimicrobiota bacterium]
MKGNTGASRGAPAPAGRLPRGVRPARYAVSLKVDPDSGTFHGRVAIDVQVSERVTELVLHALELRIPRARVAGAELPADRIRLDRRAETVTLAPREPVKPGRVTVELEFDGELNRQMRGLYLSTAKHRGKVERYAFTHFEPTSARRMVPCFDEPALKAVFSLTVTAPAGLTVLSNQPARRRKVQGGWQTVTFEDSPVMSSYLLALAVARLAPKRRRVDGTPVAVWTRPEDLRQADFALDVAEASLKRLNRYFAIKYRLPKVDLVALPDFAAGAMENWGAIFFRDSALLADPRLSSARARRRVAEVVAHELVHQWFGNLVTMEWWDDLWLNEAFATWLAFKVLDDWKPAWKSWLDFETRKRRALMIDALRKTRPIIAPANTSDEIEAQFDALSYEKGGGTLRMVEAYLGETKFRKGIRAYMKRHQYANTVNGDLWRALEQASGVPVGKLASAWLTRPGYPLLTVGVASATERALTMTQRRFDAHGGAPEGVWPVPVVIRYRLKGEARSRAHRVLIEREKQEVRLPGSRELVWAYPNLEETGLYRLALAPALLAALRADWRGLAEVERGGLLNHLWARVRAGQLPIEKFLDTLFDMREERGRYLLEDAAAYLRRIETIVGDGERAAFGRAVDAFFGAHWRRLGWSGPRSEPDDAKLGRAAALAALAVAPTDGLAKEASTRLARYLKDPKSVEPALAGPLLEIGARLGDEKRFEEYRRRMGEATTPEQRDLLMTALADFRSPALARRVVDLSLTDQVRGQDIWKPLTRLLDNSGTQGEAWKCIRERWAEIREKAGPKGAIRVIEGMAALARREWLEEVRSFFADPDHQVESGERSLAQTLEAIELGIRLREAQAAGLAEWLRSSPGRT